MRILDRFIYWICWKRIERLVKERLKDVVLEEYINRELDVSNIDKGELQFRGKNIIKIMAAGFYEMLEGANAENYISMDLLSQDYERMNVIIQRVGKDKMTPHEKAKMWEEELKKALNLLQQGKLKFTPNTTNSDVDCFLEKHQKLISP